MMFSDLILLDRARNLQEGDTLSASVQISNSKGVLLVSEPWSVVGGALVEERLFAAIEAASKRAAERLRNDF